MKRLILTICACVLLFAAGSAWADFIDLPVKWAQVPWDPDGGDWLSDHLGGQVIADDFVCEIPDPIVAVRWWGSYGGETTPREDGWTGPFDISFHYSLGMHPGSLPASLITMYTVDAQEVFVGYDNSSNPKPVYRYDAYLTEPFDQWAYSQNSDNVDELFIGICKPTLQNWGWREVEPPHPILDYAAAATDHDGGLGWESIGGAGGIDMAFELMVPEPATLVLLGLGSLALLRRKTRA